MRHLTSILIVATISFLTSSLYAQGSEYNLDETYKIAKQGELHLESDDAEVTVTGSDRSDVHLVVYRRVDVDGWNVDSEGKFKIDVENKNGNLHIREVNSERHRVIFGNIDEEYRIDIKVPHSVSLSLKGDDDNYTIAAVNGSISVDADDSNIDLRGVGGNSFEFNNDDGTIRMDGGTGQLVVNLDDGEFYSSRSSFSDINLKADDAEIEIATSLANDGSYIFDMDDGDLTLNIAGGGGRFDIQHDDPNIEVGNSFETLDTDDDKSVYRLVGGKASIKIKTDDGDIELRTI